MGGYLLIAVGLINLRYQSGQSGVFGHSATIIIPGALLLVSTLVSPLVMLLDLRPTKVAVLILGIALVAYAVLN